MNGSDFVRQYAGLGLPAWEAAALNLASQGSLTPWPMVDLVLTDGANTAVVPVASDVLSIGPVEDHLRLPMTPGGAQNIFNLFGWLLPTPWLSYQIWKNASQLEPITMYPPTAKLDMWAQHSAMIDAALAAQGVPPGHLVAGIKKHVVVSNIMQPGKVVIFGWYHPSPPAPDVYDDGKPWDTPPQHRQPIQAKSNLHGDFYVDYSHGMQAVGPVATVNGAPMSTVDLYQHPTLSRLVSNEGPVRAPRYPAHVLPTTNLPTPKVSLAPAGVSFVPTSPTLSDLGVSEFVKTSGMWPIAPYSGRGPR